MVYLDYASSTPVDEEIINSYSKLLKEYFANPSALHKMGLATNSLLEKARSLIAKIINVKDNEIIFTSGASESNNLAIKGIAHKYMNRGKHLITSKVEHASVLNVFKALELEGFEVTYLDVNSDGVIDENLLKTSIRKDTILVSLMMVNNETGSINDIDRIGQVIKEANKLTFFHCDATQGFGKFIIDFKNIDLLSMSAHKIYGLKGSGFLYKKDNIMLESLINGGGQEFGLRSGTTNFPLDVMLAKTIRIAYENMDKYYKHVQELNAYLREGIKDLDYILINSPLNASAYIINISIMGIKSAIISKYFEDKDIIVSTTSACGSKTNIFSHVVEDMYPNTNRSSTAVRISLSKFNTKEDIDKLIEALKSIKKEVI